MSFLNFLPSYFNQLRIEVHSVLNENWARNVASTLPEKVQDIFNTVAANRTLRGFSDRDAFFKETHTSDVAILKTSNPHSSEKKFIAIVFYVGGISDDPIEIYDSFHDQPTSILKIRDVVSPIFIKYSYVWTIPKDTLESDFGKCVNHVRSKDPALQGNFFASEPLLTAIVSNKHPHFAVISKDDFSRRNYTLFAVWIQDFVREEGSKLVIVGNGVGMDEWKKPIPLTLQSNYHYATIRAKQEQGEYKLALLKKDGSLLLEKGENRKCKDIQIDECGQYSIELYKPSFDVEDDGWEIVGSE